MTSETGYWTFYHKPTNNDDWAEAVLLNPEVDEWQYKLRSRPFDEAKNPFRKGQQAVIRTGVDSRRAEKRNQKPKLDEGVYAIVEITGPGEEHGKGSKVPIRFLHRFIDRPLLLRELKNDPGINDSDLIRFCQGFEYRPLTVRTFLRLQERLFCRGFSEQELQKAQELFEGASPEFREIILKSIERGSTGTKVKKAAGFKCQVCEALGLNPHGFRKKNGDYYVEAHHVVPVSTRLKGCLSPTNIISVCASHHRQLHYGDCAVLDLDENNFVFRIDSVQVTISKLLHPQDGESQP